MQDASVRSIQVASALIDRVGVLMQPPTTLGTMVGAMLTSNGTSADSLELRLGEAQQTVPEIWNHLDAARDRLASGGSDVSEFDAIRGGVRVPLASTNIELDTRFSWLGGELETVKTVTWDVAGFRRAVAACSTLKRLRPDVDWAALERAQVEEIAAAGSLTASRWKQLALWAGLAAVVVAAGIAIRALVMTTPPSDPQLEHAREQRVEQAKIAEHRKARIVELQAQQRTQPCDPAAIGELQHLLILDGQLDTAKRVWDRCPR